MEYDLSLHCIPLTSTILDALASLNRLPGDALVLFVVDYEGRVLGTLTDGDVRRALISGAQLNQSAESVMNRNFHSISDKCENVTLSVRNMRRKRILLVPYLDEKGRIIKLYNLAHITSVIPVDAVLMAGGRGERLRPLTERTPKPLLMVGEKSIIDHNVDRLLSYGIENIFVTVNYLKEQLIEHFEEPREGKQILCVEEPKYLGTIGSLRLVPGLESDTVLVMNSDLFTNLNYEAFYLHFKAHNADMSIAAVPYSVAVPYGIMELEGRNLKGMIEKPTYNYYANGGIYLIRRELLGLIPDDTFFNATDFIDLLISQNRHVIRYPINGTWIDIGNPQEYQKACDLVRHLQ